MGVGKRIDAYPTGSLVLARYCVYEAISNCFILLNCVYPASRVSLQMGEIKYDMSIQQQKNKIKKPKHNS